MSGYQSTSRIRPFTFFAVTYVLSWAIWIPLLLSHWSIGPLRIDEGASSLIRLLGVLMPSVTALLLTAFVDGRTGMRDLRRRLTLWRVGWRWWTAAVLIQPLLLAITALVFNAWGGNPTVAPVADLTIVALIVQIIMLAIASLGEEIGWRGVALPTLQIHRSPMRASVILAILWATWHLPFWLLLDTIPLYGFGYLVVNYLFVLAGTFFITWFFNHSRGSLMLPVAFHLSFNIVNVALLPVTSSTPAFLIFTVLDCLIVLAILSRLEPTAAAVSQPEQTLDTIS